MRLSRRRKTNSAADRQDQLRRARMGAPTLRDSSPAATEVRVELRFDSDTRLAPAPQQLTVFPPAQAHFVYSCPFGDCDGTFDLNEKIFGMLRAQARQATGVLHCEGHRPPGGEAATRCGLGVTYVVKVGYGAE